MTNIFPFPFFHPRVQRLMKHGGSSRAVGCTQLQDAIAANSQQSFLFQLWARGCLGSVCVPGGWLQPGVVSGSMLVPAPSLPADCLLAGLTGAWAGGLEWAGASHAGASFMAQIPRGEAEHTSTSARATRGSPCAWLQPIYFALSTF